MSEYGGIRCSYSRAAAVAIIKTPSLRALLMACCIFASALLVFSADTGGPPPSCSGHEDTASGNDNGFCPNPDLAAPGDDASPQPRQLPVQFSARINTTAHRVDPAKEYPRRQTPLRVWYDQPAGRFRVDQVHSPQLSTTLIRRFDKGYSTLTTRLDKKSECRQSRVWGEMQLPEWPSKARLVGSVDVESISCQHWQDDFGKGVVDLYVDEASGAPVQVTVSTREASGSLVKDITYAVWDFHSGAPDLKSFNLPKAIKGGLAKCEREPNDIGFPYVHFFHFYYRA